MRILLALPLLSACAVTPPSGEVAVPIPLAERYRASGTEPFWSVTIADGRMVYESVDGAHVDVASPAPQSSADGRRFVTPALVVDITRAACSDGMSDRSYPDTVAVKVDGRALKGCGAPMGSDMVLADTSWRIVAVDGRPVVASEQPATLAFTADRLSGSTGCNRLFGGYALSDGRLVASGVGTTRMACAGPAMQQEAAVLTLLAQPLTVAPGQDGSATFTAPGGGSLRVEAMP